MAERVDISVVVPTFNRAGLLTRTLPALAGQKTGEFTYEVVFVSNGSTDATGDLLLEWEEKHPGLIRYFRIEPTGGPSAPRNRGIQEARGNAIVILDDDVEPDEDLVFHHARFHRDFPEPQHAALGELYVPEDMMRDPVSLFHVFPYDKIRDLPRLDYIHFWTCHVSVKRDFMLAKGMFDERFLFFEDVLCGYKLAKNGMHLHFLPGANGKHLHQLKVGGIVAKGKFIGRWLYPFEQVVPEMAVREKFGILSKDLPWPVFLRRSLNRAGLKLVDNPVSLKFLEMLGAKSATTRSRLTDLYYYAIFRGTMLRAYAEARRKARAQASDLQTAVREWVDRGE